MLTDFAIQLVASASVSVVLSALLLWITKSWISERLQQAIKSEYDQKLETHKAQLKAQSEVEIEKLRSQLSISATEHEVRFSRLHEKRADVIANLYELLAEALREAELFLSPIGSAKQPDGDTQLFAAEKKLLQLYRYFDNNKIYLPSELCCSLEQLIEEVKMHVITYAVHLDHDDGSTRPEKREARRTALKAIQEQVVVAWENLENEFRSLLGAAR